MSDKKGNGVDLGAVYQAVLAVSADVQSVKAEVQSLKTEVQSIKAEVQSIKADLHSVKAEVQTLGRRLSDVEGKLDGLREQVVQYHATVIGHGVLYSEIEARVRRIERHLDLPAA